LYIILPLVPQKTTVAIRGVKVVHRRVAAAWIVGATVD